MIDAMNTLISEIKNGLRDEIKQEILAELQEKERHKKVWMNKKETAAYLGISPNTFSKYLEKYPNFPVSDFAGAKRYNPRKIDEFIAITDMMN